MSSPMGQGGRGLILRLVLAEVLAKRGQGPLAPRFMGLLAQGSARFDARAGRERARALLESERAERGKEHA
jgi:hypothetical protein